MGIRHVARRIIASEPVIRVVDRIMPGRLAIFMLHRFDDGSMENGGHHVGALRRSLEYLRRYRHPIVGLGDLNAAIQEGSPIPHRGVVFTVDDGYADFTALALPVFEQYDAPVTVFLTTDFLDGRCWLWWDRIGHLFRSSKRTALDIELRETRFSARWKGEEDCDRMARALAHELVFWCPESREAAIAAVAEQLEVTIPSAPPREYAPMTWADARHAETRGTTFGPHTLDHPTLTTLADVKECERQISGSWRRLHVELRNPLRVFCYPNGDARSFGDREINVLDAAGFRLAVTALPGYLPSGRRLYGWEHAARLSLPRFPCPVDAHSFIRVASGFERLRSPITPYVPALTPMSD